MAWKTGVASGPAGPAPVIDAVDDVTALRAINTAAQNPGDVIYLQGVGFFAWSATSTAADNMGAGLANTVCKPNLVDP